VASKQKRVFLVVADKSSEMKLALRYACRRAVGIDGRIALLHIMESADFQHWVGVGDLYRQERREEGEELIAELTDIVKEQTNKKPIVYFREGEAGPTLYDFLNEEKSIKVVVIATGVDGDGPGPIINYILNKGIAHLPKPFIIVPGSMSIDEIDDLT
jgi:nucleotide-binding universal stress UspA family protein